MNPLVVAAIRNPSEDDPHVCFKNAAVAAREERMPENKTAKPMSHVLVVSADPGWRDEVVGGINAVAQKLDNPFDLLAVRHRLSRTNVTNDLPPTLPLALQIDIEASGFEPGELSVVLCSGRSQRVANSLHETLMLLPNLVDVSPLAALTRGHRLHQANLVRKSARSMDRTDMNPVQESQVSVIVRWLEHIDCSLFSIMQKIGSLGASEVPDVARAAYSSTHIFEDMQGSVRLTAHLFTTPRSNAVAMKRTSARALMRSRQLAG